MASRDSALVAGHSFVRRAAFDAARHGTTFDLDRVTVHTLGIGGAGFQGRKDIFLELPKFIRQHQPKLLVLDVGSNDLDSRKDPAELADIYFEKLLKLQNTFKLKVVVCQAIPRHPRRRPDSAERIWAFNTHLANKIDGVKDLHYWKHQGLNQKEGKLLASDGVHLNARGGLKYYYSIRRALAVFSR